MEQFTDAEAAALIEAAVRRVVRKARGMRGWQLRAGDAELFTAPSDSGEDASG